ncbi:MAG: metallophosphoesterase [Gammaproteobacteria bacterium]|nr:metallophosphoesterase [Gammaproteobacteria bacterium]
MGKKKNRASPKEEMLKLRCKAIPKYRGEEWISTSLPKQCELWLPGLGHSIGKDSSRRQVITAEMQDLLERHHWKWPKQAIYFVSDLHADADAFLASLVASGGVEKSGRRDKELKLTKRGRGALFLVGGDCFDKGPSNLRLLRVIRLLMKSGARVRILAGNHDVRMLQGINSVGLEPDPRTDHFFVRLGPKTVPFLKEIWDEYLEGSRGLRGVPSLRECRRRLYPSKRWFNDFPRLASWIMPEKSIERELKRLCTKLAGFEESCSKAGMDLRMIYAAVQKWEQHFIHKKGEFSWFFKQMCLAYRAGSFLFIHAGLDDRIAQIIQRDGVKRLNREFQRQILDDPFEFYYGPLANTVRTKYRDVDMPLTRRGIEMVKKQGIYAIVHGHNNRLHGQHIVLRQGILDFECDATLDRNSRKKVGLKGIGAAATVFTAKRQVIGISNDYPWVRLFDPRALVGKR